MALKSICFCILLMKKYVCFLILFLLVFTPVTAKAQGRVILNAENDDVYYPENVGVLETSANYVNDLKKYIKTFDENSEADITEELMDKYPYFDEEHAKKWQEYLKNGAEVYAWYEKAKKKVVDWVASVETPLRFDDSQYEMGENEEYIPADNPLVIHDFKKVVSYSNSPKDRLAVKEKLAIDSNSERPSEAMAKLKKAFVNKDWAAVFNFDWRDLLPERFNGKKLATDSKNENVKAVILSEYTGVGKDGKFAGTIEIKPKEKTLVLLQKYKNYEGIKVDFSASENLKKAEVKFTAPLMVKTKDDSLLLGYANSFPVYFEAEVNDVTKPLKLDCKIQLNVCRDYMCSEENLKLVTEIPVTENIYETTFSAHVALVRGNVPQDKNIRNFDFSELEFDEKNDILTLRAKSSRASQFEIFIYGDKADNFSQPKLQIDGNVVTASFVLKNKSFNPLGKTLKMWVGDSGVNQCIVEKTVVAGDGIMPKTDNMFGLVLMVVVCGLALFIMPGALPITIAKMMKLSEFGGAKSVKYEFGYAALGVLTFFGAVIVSLSILNLSGYSFVWGAHLENPYFLTAIIWVEIFMLLGFWKLFDLTLLLHKYKKTAAVLSGLLTAILALVYTPPYMEDIVVILNQKPWMMPFTLALLGVCAALPYFMVLKYKKLASYFADPDKWQAMFKNAAVAVLIINIFLTVSILGRVLNCGIKFAWLGYFCVVWLILYTYKIFKQEIRKSYSAKISVVLVKRAKLVVAVLISLVALYTILKTGKLSNEIFAQKEISATMLNIENEVRLTNKVLVKIDSDWCLVCMYNDLMVFDDTDTKERMQKNQVREYDIEPNSTLAKKLQKTFMKNSLPLYILFSPKYPNGIALSDKIDINDFKNLIEM